MSTEEEASVSKKERSKEKIIFKVRSTTNVKSLSEAVYRTYLEGTSLEIQAVGPSAVNQSIKSIIEARAKLVQAGYNVLVNPFFRDVVFDGSKTKSAIVFQLKNVE